MRRGVPAHVGAEQQPCYCCLGSLSPLVAREARRGRPVCSPLLVVRDAFPAPSRLLGTARGMGQRDCPQSLMKATSHIQILSAPCLIEVNFWERCFVTEDFPGTGVPTPSACSPHARPGVTACGCKSCPLQRGGMGRKAYSSSPLAV